jgi:hypothetical protein
MRIQSRLIHVIRPTLVASTLLLSGFLAHMAGCGVLVSGEQLFVETGVLIGLIAFFARGNLEGPRLATLAIIAQLSVHFVLGGMVMNTSRMLCFHILFGIISYFVISGIENYGKKLLKIALLLLNVAASEFEMDVIKGVCAVYAVQTPFFSTRSRRLGALRAPPFFTS